MDKYIRFDIDCKKTAASLRPENMKRPSPCPDNLTQRLVRAEPAIAWSYAGAGRPFHIGVMVERGHAIPLKGNKFPRVKS